MLHHVPKCLHGGHFHDSCVLKDKLTKKYQERALFFFNLTCWKDTYVLKWVHRKPYSNKNKRYESFSLISPPLLSLSLTGSQGSQCQLLDNRTAVSRSAKELQAPRGWIKPISSCQSPWHLMCRVSTARYGLVRLKSTFGFPLSKVVDCTWQLVIFVVSARSRFQARLANAEQWSDDHLRMSRALTGYQLQWKTKQK